MATVSSNRQHYIDKKFESDLINTDFSNSLFLRLVAKGIRFDKVDFKKTIFDTCYLRNCVFDSCNFTGCRFIGVNFYGASFSGCIFDYATFERTIIDSNILDVGCPGWDNLKLKFARTLRMNFQQLGDPKAVNKAIKVELDATQNYLHKAWHSNESYYRKKYTGWKRFSKFFEWLNFEVLNFIWGNGESTFRLIRSVFLLLLFMSFIHVFLCYDPTKISSYWNSFLSMPSVFLGVSKPEVYSDSYLAFIFFMRLVAIGFFMSIIIKRLNRR
jgi:preprotein translocase subunit SecE